MSTDEAITIIKSLAAQSPCDWDNRLKAIEAVKTIENSLATAGVTPTASTSS
tara:strand:- start:2179 stop:2334 length:156 start_codon:yes stop_codon:yes gene_type:complete